MQNPDVFGALDWDALTDVPGGLPILPATDAESQTLDEWLRSGAELSGGQQTLAALMEAPTMSLPAEKPAILVFTPISQSESPAQAALVSDPAREALREIGLAVQADFNLARDSFRDAETGERLLNGIFQRDPSDPAQNARPLLVAVAPNETGSGLAAQAIEYGRTGSLIEAQADVERVQTALEQGGIEAGITAIETLNADLNTPAPSGWSMEIS